MFAVWANGKQQLGLGKFQTTAAKRDIKGALNYKEHKFQFRTFSLGKQESPFQMFHCSWKFFTSATQNVVFQFYVPT